MNKIYVDKARLLRRVIVISWISLAFCFVVKIFGGNFFEIMCQSKNYKALCDYADTHLWLKFVIGFLSSMLCQCLCELAILQKYKLTLFEFIITFASVFACTMLKLFNINPICICDIWLSFILPAILVGKDFKRYIAIIFAFVFNIGFQFISLLVKNIGIVNVGDTYFIGIIYMFDLYIMIFLYYLYRNFLKKEK
jgi:hypothetical protein